MIQICLVFCFFIWSFYANSEIKKKWPSISYKNIIECYPELKNSKMEYDVQLSELKKTIDLKYPTVSSVMKFRRVVYKKTSHFDLVENKKNNVHIEGDKAIDPEKAQVRKRLTLRLVNFKNNKPEYKLSLETIGAENIGETDEIPKSHERNPSKEIINSYLISASIEEDESQWIDTKSNRNEIVFKKMNENITELEFSTEKKAQESVKSLKCDDKKGIGVLCLCLNNK